MITSQGWKVRYQVLGGYLIPVVLTLISAIIVFTNVQKVRQQEADLRRVAQVEAKIGDLGFHVQTLSRSTRGYLLFPEPSSKQEFDSARTTIQALEQVLDELIMDRTQKLTFEQIKEKITQVEQLNQELIDLVDQGKTQEAFKEWRNQTSQGEVTSVFSLLTELKNREEAIVADSVKAQDESLTLLVNTVIGSTVLAIILSLLFGTWIINLIANKLTFTATTLAESSSEIAATIEEQERTASAQAASVNQTTTTMDELGASSRQSSEQAETAALSAQHVLQLAEQGNQAVNQTLTGMDTLKEKVSAIAQQILRLSEQTSQIGNISQLVTDIANQTNMLALNAAVEAVRAGEHGKGFSVVATEIRKLADQSKQSAQKINQLVADIQNSINSTVMVTDEGTKTVEISVQTTQMTAQTFGGMSQALNNVVLNNQQIALNIKQQAVAIQQVIQAMNTLNQGAKQTADGISQSRIGTQRLNEATKSLKEMV